MKIVTKKLSELHIPEQNIRRHTDKQLKEYARSLEMFDQIKPIVIDENGEIIAGNGLYLALQMMGKEECECYVKSGMTPAQKKKLMLADNRVYELGITDMDAFDEIIRSLDGDIDVPGWDADLLAMMNSMTEDLDEAVTSYGAYEKEDVNRLSERSVSAGQEQTSAATPTAAPAAGSEDGEEEERTYIVCPKCGERICL